MYKYKKLLNGTYASIQGEVWGIRYMFRPRTLWGHVLNILFILIVVPIVFQLCGTELTLSTATSVAIGITLADLIVPFILGQGS